MSDHKSDVDITATITTVADNTGADQARQAIDNLGQTTRTVTDQQSEGARQSREESAAQAAAIGDVARATETLSGTYTGLGDKTAAVNKGTQEFFSATTATSGQYIAALDKMGGKMDALKGKTKAVTAATKELGDTAADASIHTSDANADLTRNAEQAQKFLDLLRSRRGLSGNADVISMTTMTASLGGIATRLKSILDIGGKVTAIVSRFTGIFGLITLGIGGIKLAWDALNKSARDAARQREADLIAINDKLKAQHQLIHDLTQQEANRNAQKTNLGTLQVELDLMLRRNEAIEKTTRLQLEAADFSARIANDKIELRRLDLIKKLQEKTIDEIEYKKQDIALLKQQTTLTRDLAEARAKANLESARGQQQAASKSFSEALTQQRNTSDSDILSPGDLRKKQEAKALIEADHGRIYTEISGYLKGMDAYRMSPQEMIMQLRGAKWPMQNAGDTKEIAKVDRLIDWIQNKKDTETAQKETLSSDVQKHNMGLTGLGYTPNSAGLEAYQTQREQQAAAVKSAHDELTASTEKVTEAERDLSRTREENAISRQKEDKQADNELADLAAKKELELKERTAANTTSRLAEQIDLLKKKMETASSVVKSAQTEGRNRLDRLHGKNNPQLDNDIKKMDLENILTQNTLSDTDAKNLAAQKKELSESKWKDEQARKDLLDMITQILASYKANAAALKDKPKLDALIKLQTSTSRRGDAEGRKDLTKEVYEKVKKSIAEDMEKAERAKTQTYKEDRNIAVTLNKTKAVLADDKISQQEQQTLLSMLQQWQNHQKAGNNSDATQAIIAALQNILTNFTSSADAYQKAVTACQSIEKKFGEIDKRLTTLASQITHQS